MLQFLHTVKSSVHCLLGVLILLEMEISKEEFSKQRQFLNSSEKLIFLIENTKEIFTPWGDGNKTRKEAIFDSNNLF